MSDFKKDNRLAGMDDLSPQQVWDRYRRELDANCVRVLLPVLERCGNPGDMPFEEPSTPDIAA